MPSRITENRKSSPPQVTATFEMNLLTSYTIWAYLLYTVRVEQRVDIQSVASERRLRHVYQRGLTVYTDDQSVTVMLLPYLP